MSQGVNQKLFRKCFVFAPSDYEIYWKVCNVGEEAKRRNCIRGQIIKTNKTTQIEHTNFRGEHFVECYLVKYGNNEFLHNISIVICRINRHN